MKAGQKQALIDRMKRDKADRSCPSFGVMIDVDRYETYPKVVKPNDFAMSSAAMLWKRIPRILELANGG
jgi:hypothetical protein